MKSLADDDNDKKSSVGTASPIPIVTNIALAIVKGYNDSPSAWLGATPMVTDTFTFFMINPSDPTD